MSARDLMFGSIRRALGVTGSEAPRRQIVADRLARHPKGVIPARGQLAPAARVDLFIDDGDGGGGRPPNASPA